MPIAEHLIRRGAVYWWRRRFSANKRTGLPAWGCLALSLNTTDPLTAKALSRNLNAKVESWIASKLAPNPTRDQAKLALRQFIAEETRRLEEWAYRERQKPLWMSAPDPSWSPAQYGEYLDWGAKLTAAASEIVLELGDRLDLTKPDFEYFLAKRGFEEKDRFFIQDFLMANRATMLRPGEGAPPVEYLDDLLRRIGAPVTEDNQRELCRLFLVAHAYAQRQTTHAQVNEGNLLGEILREDAAEAAFAAARSADTARFLQAPSPAAGAPGPMSVAIPIVPPEATHLGGHRFRGVADPPVEQRVKIDIHSTHLSPGPLEQATSPAEKIASEVAVAPERPGAQNKAPSLIAIVEDMAESRMCLKEKDKRWTPKTARQHCSNHGRSSKDADLPLSKILERASTLPKNQVGLAGSTIDRYMTQLGTILKRVRAAGFVVGDVATLTDLRVNADSSKNGRKAFTEDELRTLFSAPVWTGRSLESFTEAGDFIVHDAYYWAPLIVNYSGMRLSEGCAATLAEVRCDSAFPMFDIADTAVREVKSEASERRIPIHPELIRLGFLDYVAELRRRGETLLFPDLRARGQNTPLGNLFDKYWSKILDHALPEARKSKKTFHSFRKTLNTAIANAREPDVLRKELLGHAKQGANEINYTEDLEYKTKLEILTERANVTSHLVRHPLRMWNEGLRGRKKRTTKRGVSKNK